MAVVACLVIAGCGSKPGCNVNVTSSSGAGGGTSNGVGAGATACNPNGGTGGGGGSTGASAAFLYYIDGSGVQVASLGTNGTLATVTGVTPPTLAGSFTDDMVAVNNKFLYVPFSDSTSLVQGLGINSSSGTLSTITGSPFALQSGVLGDGIVTDPQGRFLFLGDETGSSGSISVFQIDSTTGALTPAPGSPFFATPAFEIDSMAVDGNGKFLYAAQGSASSPVFVFSIDQSTGALSQIAGSPFSLGVAQLHADPSGKFLLGVADIADAPGVANDPHISVFAIDPTTGTPTAVAGSPFATTAAPFDFVIHPNGKFVYTTGVDVTTGAIAPIEGFQLDANTGSLSLLSPFSGLTGALCKSDPAGGVIFCDQDNAGSGFTVFNVNSTTGALTQGPTLNIANSAFAWTVTD
jgi:6-phosphogluconolactonase (cycloisomerase 2 family)